MILDGQSKHRPCEVCNPGGGYKRHKPGYFYALRLIDSDDQAIAKKNGITNHPRLRMLRLSLSLSKFNPGLRFEVEEIFFNYNGWAPYEVEKWAKKQGALPKKPFDGGAELYSENMLRKYEQETNAPMVGWQDLTGQLIDELANALDRYKRG